MKSKRKLAAIWMIVLVVCMVACGKNGNSMLPNTKETTTVFVQTTTARSSEHIEQTGAKAEQKTAQPETTNKSESQEKAENTEKGTAEIPASTIDESAVAASIQAAEQASREEESRKASEAAAASSQQAAEQASREEESRKASEAAAASSIQAAEQASREEESRKAAEAAAAAAAAAAARANPSGADYIANTNTMKFHYPGCHSVDRMKEENKWYFHGERQELINKGFDPCKNCNP